MPESDARVVLLGDVAMPGEDNAVGEEDVASVERAFEEWRYLTEISGGSLCRVTSAAPTPPVVDLSP